MKYILYALCLWLMSTPSFAAYPEPNVNTTPSGVTYAVVDDTFLPIVSLKLTFKHAGYAYEDASERGLVEMATMLLQEGAGPWSSIAFKEYLETYAIALSVDSDADHLYINIKCLSKHVNKALVALQYMVHAPHFSQEAIARVKQQLQTSQKRSLESSRYLASKALKQALFDKHPYARSPGDDSVDYASISKDHLMRYVRNAFTKESLVLSIVGDIQDDLPIYIDKALGALPNTNPNHRPLPKVIWPKTTKDIKVAFDSPQSTIMFAHPAPNRNDPDFYPTYVANHIIGGGGFESRLMDRIRENKGLTYGISTNIHLLQDAAFWVGSVNTKHDNVEMVKQLIKEELERMHGDYPLTDEELSIAKSYLVGSFPLRMVRNSHIASFLNVMQIDNLGMDFLNRRNGLVDAVTLSHVNAAAKNYIRSNPWVLVHVGQKASHLP